MSVESQTRDTAVAEAIAGISHIATLTGLRKISSGVAATVSHQLPGTIEIMKARKKPFTAQAR